MGKEKKKLIQLFTVPYDSGHYNERMGRGPLYVVNHALMGILETAGYEVLYEQIKADTTFATEIATTVGLLHQIKAGVKAAIAHHALPIVLAGNCSASVGAVAGLGREDMGILWFDAHGDCETPDTTTSGFFDGMALSMLLGTCWHNLLSSLQSGPPVPGKHIALMGARDLSEAEKKFIQAKGIHHIPVEQIKNPQQTTIKQVMEQFTQAGLKKLHIHIDVDVCDPSVAPANAYAVSNGLSKESLYSTLRYCMSQLPLASVTIAAYDPHFDENHRMLATIHEMIRLLAEGTA
jgi:arginase